MCGGHTHQHRYVKEGEVLIGELAEHTGTTTKTLRFYEDEGLLPPSSPSRIA
jgi:MerR-like DNA binding protein